jgi:hypothetical protein
MDYLILSNATMLTLRIYFVPGREPSTLALDGLNQTIRQVTDKEPVIASYQSIPPRGGGYSLTDLHNVTASLANREPPLENFLRIVYLDGEPEIYEGARGLFDRGRTIFVFLDGADSDLMVGVQLYGLGINQLRPYAERGILVHEFGHVLGLVNCGLPMVEAREDPQSQCHSSQDDSVMIGGVNSVGNHPDKVAYTGIEPIWTFNRADLADIQAYRQLQGTHRQGDDAFAGM